MNNNTDDLLNSSDDVDDFERMLSEFISKEFEDSIEEAKEDLNEAKEEAQIQTESDNSSLSQLADEPRLGEHEFSLFRAYKNFMYAINILTQQADMPPIRMHLNENKLYPHYKKRAGNAVSKDILKGWDILIQLFPKEMSSISPSSSDDELLDYAEKCENENIQLAVISHVETMIELEGCEIDYQVRKLAYERKQLEKIIYEEHQKRIERSKKYINAIKEKEFPIDAERLVNNYFRLSNKDPEGSFKALTKNPATFAPIDFSKIKDRFFGLIKVKPQDGIRINQKIGEFLKNLKI
ncbi:MAG: hypothetical protein IJ545_04125 [Alphaproteobacteria bacterium]|nr:hypothetical protein [Alphaproteobacteria bacterium]